MHPDIRAALVSALEAVVRCRPIWRHFEAWREWTHEIFSKTRAYQLWFRKTLPCRRALTAWTLALQGRRAVEVLAARRFPQFSTQRVLRAWWLAAAEGVSRGPLGGNTATAAAVRAEMGATESTAAWVAWESRGRPLQHWLGRALTIAANIPWHRSALAIRERGSGANTAQAIEARTAEATKSLIDRTLRAGKCLNRDRDAHHGALGVLRETTGSALGSFGSRPKLAAKMRNTEGDALRILSDALEHAGDIIAGERASADARVSAAMDLADDSEHRERRRRQITLELFHQRGEMSRAAAAVAAVKASGGRKYDVHDRQHQQAVQHIVRVSTAQPALNHSPAASPGARLPRGPHIDVNDHDSYHGFDGDGFDYHDSGGGGERFADALSNTGRLVSGTMFGREFVLPPPGESRSWMGEEQAGRAASTVAGGGHVELVSQRVATAPAGTKRQRPGALASTLSSALARTAGGVRGGTLPGTSTRLSTSAGANHRPGSAGSRAPVVMATGRGGAGGARRPSTSNAADNGGHLGSRAFTSTQDSRSLQLPAPGAGAVTGPRTSRAEAEVERHRRGLQESREAIASLSHTIGARSPL
jgi:hypothetical protein